MLFKNVKNEIPNLLPIVARYCKYEEIHIITIYFLPLYTIFYYTTTYYYFIIINIITSSGPPSASRKRLLYCQPMWSHKLVIPRALRHYCVPDSDNMTSLTKTNNAGDVRPALRHAATLPQVRLTRVCRRRPGTWQS